jgi:hypothetical protein
LLEPLVQRVRQHTGEDVRGSSRRKWNDESHGAIRVLGSHKPQPAQPYSQRHRSIFERHAASSPSVLAGRLAGCSPHTHLAVTAVMRLRCLELAAYGNHSGVRYKIPIGASAQALPGIVVGPIWSMFGAENGDADRWQDL